MATAVRALVAARPVRPLLPSRRLPSSSSIRPPRQRGGVGSVRCMARRPDSSYSPLRSGQGGDRAPTEMAPLFPGCDYEHWLIVMDKPGGEGATKQQMIDCYIQTLAQVVGSEEEAKKKIYNVSCERYFGFGCEIDEETSNKLEGLPGVLFVLPDSYVDAENKDYGAIARKAEKGGASASESSRSTPIQVCCRAHGEGSEAAAHEERLRLRRRDFIGTCVGTAIGLELIDGSTRFFGVATAADLIERRQRSEFQSKIKDTLYVAIKAKPELVPSLLTLALNDAITYDKATKTGGANGSIRLETSRPENSELSAALDLLTEAKKEIDSFSKGGPISFADLIQFAAQSALKRSFLDAAIAKCGGNEEKGRTLYSAYGSNGQWGLFDRTFGRADAQEADPEGRVPEWSKASVQEMKDRFVSVGLGPRQLAVMSAFLGPDQAATEERLIADPGCRPWVEKYQRSRETVSRTDYEVDLITTLTKLNSLGQNINYEAYTYPKQKIDLGKLKL
ncbi:unnamed protein product [Miscanthus lutarioriparius]|uniref:Uncharacterized protein n=1 Tax=Miscanthus lutarioriparius TaxID=422564 RepID=A0A811R0F8_9POAL|nr:unnamed protein product [Miscanthus lutarioriparius]